MILFMGIGRLRLVPGCIPFLAPAHSFVQSSQRLLLGRSVGPIHLHGSSVYVMPSMLPAGVGSIDIAVEADTV